MDTSTIAVWLAVIAVSSVIQTAVIVGAALVAWRAYRNGVEAVETFRAKQLDPLIARVHESLDDVRGAVNRVRSVDDDVRGVIKKVGNQTSDAIAAVRLRVLPAVALVRGFATAFRTFKDAFERRPVTRPRPDLADGRARTARFGYEGEVQHVRN